MFVTKQERITLLYTVPLIILLIVLLFIFLRTKPALLPSRNIGCVICHPGKLAKFEHPPYAKMQCLSCHTPHQSQLKGLKSGPSKLNADIGTLCGTCHERQAQLSDKIVHEPYVKGQCLSCHSPHGSNYPNIFVNKIGDVCRSCHHVLKYTEKKNKHKPFAEGWCVSCHAGHSSNVQARLRKPQKELCLGCHETIARDVNKPFQMEPFTKGECTECHNPHSSDNEKVLQAAMPELCVKCHGSEWGQFMAGGSRHPVPEGKLKCVNCHVPHGAWWPKLLQGKFDKSGGGCGSCHVPHGSKAQYLISVNKSGGERESEICTTCHITAQYNAEQTHPVKNRWDTSAKKELSCTSTCHQGLYWPEMDIFAGEICLNCHTGHNSPAAAIGGSLGRKTNLLNTGLDKIREKSWKNAPTKDREVKPVEVKIDAPGGQSNVKAHNLAPKAQSMIGKYHRLAESQQFKMKSDAGCMLCHNVYELP